MKTIADFTATLPNGETLSLADKAWQSAAGGQHRQQVRLHPAV